MVRSRYGSALTRVTKTGGDFATAADIEAEQAILDVLRAARPDDAVVAEESGRTGTGDNGRTWLVDPLCGTLNFAARTMLVSVNVALRRRVGRHSGRLGGPVRRGGVLDRRRRRVRPATRGRTSDSCRRPSRRLSTSTSTRRFPTGTSFLAARHARRRGLPRTVPPPGGLHQPGRGLGRRRPPRRLRDGRPRPAQQRPLRGRHRALRGGRLRGHRARRPAACTPVGTVSSWPRTSGRTPPC